MSSSFVSWSVQSVFRDVSGRIRRELEIAGSEQIHQVGKEHIKCASPIYWTPWTAFLLLYSPKFLKNLKDTIFLWSTDIFILCQVDPRMLLTVLPDQDYKFLPNSQSCLFLRENKGQRLRLNFFVMKEINSLTVVGFLIGKNKNWLIIIFCNINNICVLVLSFLLLSFFHAGILIAYTLTQGTNKENYCYKLQYQRMKRRLWRGKNILLSIVSLIGRVVFIFWQKMDGLKSRKWISNCFSSRRHLIYWKYFPSWMEKKTKSMLRNSGSFMDI